MPRRLQYRVAQVADREGAHVPGDAAHSHASSPIGPLKLLYVDDQWLIVAKAEGYLTLVCMISA